MAAHYVFPSSIYGTQSLHAQSLKKSLSFPVFKDSVADPIAKGYGLAQAYSLQSGHIYQYA